MAHLVRYLPEALEDLFDIWVYVASQSQSEIAADRVVDDIDARAMLYAKNVELGELRPDLAESVRCFTVDRFVVFYRPNSEGIEVLQVIHGSRDIPRHFRRHKS